MNFPNDPIADEVSQQMKSLKAKGVVLNTHDYNRVFEAFYSLLSKPPEVIALDDIKIPKESQPEEKWEGVIIKHHPAPETYGGVAIRTVGGNYAVVKECQEKASENIGERVIVTKVPECYMTVKILEYKKTGDDSSLTTKQSNQ